LGITTLTSCPSLHKAFGSEDATSASPPVFAKGSTSEDAKELLFFHGILP